MRHQLSIIEEKKVDSYRQEQYLILTVSEVPDVVPQRSSVQSYQSFHFLPHGIWILLDTICKNMLLNVRRIAIFLHSLSGVLFRGWVIHLLGLNAFSRKRSKRSKPSGSLMFAVWCCLTSHLIKYLQRSYENTSINCCAYLLPYKYGTFLFLKISSTKRSILPPGVFIWSFEVRQTTDTPRSGVWCGGRSFMPRVTCGDP